VEIGVRVSGQDNEQIPKCGEQIHGEEQPKEKEL
jgi:hypothetical protein